jgi:fluoride exporter
MLPAYLAVTAGGALGSVARLWMSSTLAARFGETFPVGTFVVNALGCLVIGLFTAVTSPDGPFLVSPLVRHFVSIGILGGFTTFSSFGLQTITMLTDGEWFYATLYVLLSVTVCLAFVWVGIMLGSTLTPK